MKVSPLFLQVSPMQGVYYMRKMLMCYAFNEVSLNSKNKLKLRDTSLKHTCNTPIYSSCFTQVSLKNTILETLRDTSETLEKLNPLAWDLSKYQFRDTWIGDIWINQVCKPICGLFDILQVSPSVSSYAYELSPSVSSQEVQ